MDVLNVKKRKKNLEFAPVQPDPDKFSEQDVLSDEESEADIDLEEVKNQLEKLVNQYYKAVVGKDGTQLTLRKKRSRIGWLENLVVAAETPLTLTPAAINDDFKRELSFYGQALEAAKVGVTKLIDAGETVWRPNDFMCEMFKDDRQMDKVKERLEEQQNRIETVERRRKVKHNKSFAKAVTAKRNERKTQMKKEAKVKKSKASPGNFKIGRKRSSSSKK
mmetsp:Transcript_26704/g.48096  ORF Transcript_26704/g.48096 Transcript_26704/m.48096 type:complete len:220 (+) Transcript_26704:85-744(+)